MKKISRRWILYIFYLSMALSIIGCGGSSEPSTMPPDNLQVTNSSPVDNVTDVDADADLSMTFNKVISMVAGKHFQIYKTDGNLLHTDFDVNVAQVIVNNDQVTINPNNHLIYGTAHYVKIDAGAFKDAAGNDYAGISDTTTWNFSVPSGSGPCGMDCVDNCDLPAALQ